MPTPSDQTVLRVIIAHDHRLVCSALARLVRSFAGMEVVAQIDDGQQLPDALADCAVDIVVANASADAAAANLSGLDTVAAAANRYPGIPVLVLTTEGDPGYARAACQAGAGGLVTGHADSAQFEDAIRRVARGETFVLVPERRTARRATAPNGNAPAVALTVRQLEVLKLVVAGCSTKDIAVRLGVSIKTVETHRGDLLRRLGVCNTAALVREALRLNLLA